MLIAASVPFIFNPYDLGYQYGEATIGVTTGDSCLPVEDVVQRAYGFVRAAVDEGKLKVIPVGPVLGALPKTAFNMGIHSAYEHNCSLQAPLEQEMRESSDPIAYK